MNAQDIMRGALKHAERREFLAKHGIRCPKCGTNQVQLMDHFVSPAEWRCRHCRHEFTYEPVGGPSDC